MIKKKNPSKVDDYYMMSEVLNRRLKIRKNSEIYYSRCNNY